jgi:hypothetical protein
VNGAVSPESIGAGQVVDLAGIATYVDASDSRRASALAATLRSAAPLDEPPTIAVHFGDYDFDQPTLTGSDTFAVYQAGAGTAFVKGTSTLVARVTRDDIAISGDAPDLAVALRPLFWLALAHLLVHRDRHVLHAAMFAMDDGCLLAFGPTGAGKSTLALSALQSGWTVLGDDVVVIDHRDGELQATALPRPLVVPADVAGGTSATPVPGDARGRLELGQRLGASTAYDVRGCLVVVHGARPHTALDDLEAIDVLPTVLSACLVAYNGASLRARLPMAAALSRFPAVRLAHGTDVSTRLDDGAAALRCVLERIKHFGDQRDR